MYNNAFFEKQVQRYELMKNKERRIKIYSVL